MIVTENLHKKIRKMVLIGICGFQGAGKDTIANYLVNYYGFIKYSFGEAVKDVVATTFSWERRLLEGDTEESRIFRETVDEWWSAKLDIPNFTPRMAMQKVATDVFRNNLHQNIWVDIVERKISIDLKNGKNVVISDCRFPNEFEMLREYSGNIIHVKRNTPRWFNRYMNGENCEETSDIHVSELMWIREKFDHTLDNTSTIEVLGNIVDMIINSIINN